MSRLEIYQARPSADGDWRWRLVAGNGRTVASGEGFVSKRNAIRAALAMQRAAREPKFLIEN